MFYAVELDKARVIEHSAVMVDISVADFGRLQRKMGTYFGFLTLHHDHETWKLPLPIAITEELFIGCPTTKAL